MVLMMAQKGQVQSQITDAYLKQMLEGISEGGEGSSAPKVTFDRRRFGDDSDSDIDLDGL
jgi:DNA-binding TFAR19-related protein (PDSD5 family)